VPTTLSGPIRATPRRLRQLAFLVAVSAAPTLAQDAAPLHLRFDTLLREHVHDGLVDYDAFERSPQFAQYLKELARTNPHRLPKAEQLAFWINAYNAYTIQQINAHGERASIRNINRTFGMLSAGGAWKEPMAVIGGRSYTLDQIAPIALTSADPLVLCVQPASPAKTVKEFVALTKSKPGEMSLDRKSVV